MTRFSGREGTILLGLACATMAGCSTIDDLFEDDASAPVSGVVEPISPATLDAYDAELARIEALSVTSDLPTSGTATFNGATRLAVTDNVQGTVDSEVLGDLVMEVDFDPGKLDPVSTEISNLQALSAAGTVTDLQGSLVSEPSLYPSSIDVTTTTLTDANGNTTQATSGTLESTVVGEVSDWSGSSEVILLLGGTFHGSGATGVAGSVSGTVDEATDPGHYSIDGTFWAEQ